MVPTWRVVIADIHNNTLPIEGLTLARAQQVQKVITLLGEIASIEPETAWSETEHTERQTTSTVQQ